MKTGRRACSGRMSETGAGMAIAADWPTILHPRRPARQEGAAPQRVTDGSQERGSGQGAVGAAAGSGWAGRKGRIGGTPVKYGDPKYPPRQ